MTNFEPLLKFAKKYLVARDNNEAEPYLESWKGRGNIGEADYIIFWDNISDLQKIIKYCFDNNIVIQPRGGGTALNDSTRPPTDNEDNRAKIVLVSLYKDIEIFEKDNIVRVGASVTPYELNNYLKKFSYQVRGADTGAKENSQFGAMVTTNTGGNTAEVEGSMAENIVGVDFVTANGQIIKTPTLTFKDNAVSNFGKILSYLNFPAAIITDIYLKLYPTYKQNEAFMIGVDNIEDAEKIRDILKSNLDVFLISVELIEKEAYETVFNFTENIRNPFNKNYNYNLYCQVVTFIDKKFIDLSNITEQVLFSLFESDINLDEDGLILATDEAQKENMSQIRHHVTIAAGIRAQKSDAYIKGFDISVPLSKLAYVIEEINKIVKEYLPSEVKIIRFGHFLGARLHNNLMLPKNIDKNILSKYIEQIDKLIKQVSGSIASEHGPGRDLVNRIKFMHPEIYKLMLDIKKSWDPKGLIAPGVGVEKYENI